MAIDTAAKRGSALGWGQVSNLTVPRPDGTIAQADRQTLALMYGGIAAGALALPVIPTYDPNTRVRPGYALFTFPPKRFPPDYVKTR